MNYQAWLMLLFACAVLIGGLAVCIRLAILKERRKQDQGVEFDAGDDA